MTASLDSPGIRRRTHRFCAFFLNCRGNRLKYAPGNAMICIAASEEDTDNATLEKRLWDAADQFRANSGLKSQEYSVPVLGLIFLRFAEVRFTAQHAKLEKSGPMIGTRN
jgi:hypothetical protein